MPVWEETMSTVSHRARTVREIVVTLSWEEARAVLVALESATSDEDEDVFEFAERLGAALRVGVTT